MSLSGSLIVILAIFLPLFLIVYGIRSRDLSGHKRRSAAMIAAGILLIIIEVGVFVYFAMALGAMT